MSSMDNKIASPCVGRCGLNEDDICVGCFRTREEVTGWAEADNQERLAIINNSKQRKNLIGQE